MRQFILEQIWIIAVVKSGMCCHLMQFARVNTNHDQWMKLRGWTVIK